MRKSGTVIATCRSEPSRCSMCQMKWMRLLAEMGLGLLFLYAGGKKLFATGVSAFAADVEKYQLLPEDLVPVMAYGLPWLEVVVGVCLLGQFARRGALWWSLGMTLMFVGAIAWAWRQGLDISCGCFGASEMKISYPQKMGELFLQFIAVLVAMSAGSGDKNSQTTES